MTSPVESSTKIVPNSTKADNSNVDSVSNKVLRTVGNVLCLMGEYVLKSSLGVLALLGLFVITIGAPMGWLAIPLYIIMGSGIAIVTGKGLENFNDRSFSSI